ncbi:unnamed protein product (mitochondrion) [Plasmodiophora brassicae]|uniref:Anaphase-promoting complex subunit 4 WD40 domain-containing protein n=1 Tax=Plasmodiophora brassicae TaxID=37360 RepID=A0A3P3Y8A3_PLABS|nr:unnamed protein product [Plasmodiophora brassicae]
MPSPFVQTEAPVVASGSKKDVDVDTSGEEPDERLVSPFAQGLPRWKPLQTVVTAGANRQECLLSLVDCSACGYFAASTSLTTVRVFDCHTLQELNSLITASEDGSWQMTDLRTGESQTTVRVAEGSSLFSLDCNGRVVAAGCDLLGDIVLWDLRNNANQLGVLDEFHTDEVRDLRFHPVQRSMLISGSVDCLVNKFDLNAATLDDALVSVFNVGQPVRSFGTFGPNHEYLHSVSEIETLALCDLAQGDLLGTFPNACESLSKDLSTRYLVDCTFDPVSQQLCLVSGNYYGDCMGSIVAPQSLTPAFLMTGGHDQGVRSLCSIGGRIVTGGEDSRIVCWAPNNT